MSCNRCGQTSSTCRCSSTCGGSAYYLDTPVCPEDHCAKIYEQQFNSAICPAVAWNVPSCGQTAVVSVPGIIGASIGSYIWADTFGYFQITSFDAQRETLGITNNCTEGNAAPGTQIPSCTCFVVTVPPVVLPSTALCVAVSFTAPELNIPTDITLTTTVGLTASDTVQIGTGFYFVEAIKPNNVVTIINKGSGITPGTPVVAYDANGEPQYCLSIISSNPCDADAIADGRLLACDGDGVSAPLGDPCLQGYIPVVIDGNCNVEMQPAITPPICTHLTSPLNLVIGTDTYNIAVNSTASLAQYDILTLSGIPNNRATINTVTDGTHLNITITPSITTALTMPVGTLICTINCCELLDLVTSNLELQATYNVIGAEVTPGTLTGAAQSINGPQANAGPYVNTGTNPMDYMVTFEYGWSGYYETLAGTQQESELHFIHSYGIASGAIGTTAPAVAVTDTTVNLFESRVVPSPSVDEWYFGRSHSRTIVGTIAPGNEVRFCALPNLTLNIVSDCQIHYQQVNCKITTVLISS
jgi:hypothetical protein